ncbi:MAG: HAMP domain-containing histidine kinase [Micromonosporaceae bacterium]|nr:HAMP domain-containing histidine kinase [Micromonosporaceae bacterium]
MARRSHTAWVAARRAWRRSLQLRIVTITLVVSAALVGAFGYVVAQGITNGMLDSKVERSQQDAERGATAIAQQLQAFSQPNDPDLANTLTDVLRDLSTPRQSGGVVTAVRGSGVTLKTYPQNLIVSSAITADLRRSVTSGRQAHQIVTADIGGGAKPYLVYGTPVVTRLGPLEFYQFFPLTDEVSMANKVTTTVAATGAALVLLLAVVAALVTRLVVLPVRVAARTAQRLSAGLLDQRMVVRGEDDLALLAASFNQMAENLQRQIVRLEDMSRLQRRFTSDVSHELRTPLTTVRMAADLLFARREEFDAATTRSVELLQAELDRFEALLTDLLEISRFDAGFAVLDAEPTDLVQVVQRVVARFATLADRAGVELRVRVPPTPVIAEVDARRVERVLRNLIGNAIEHAEAKPVDIALGASDSAVAVTVRDHGVGLRAGEEKLVFNRFWRADPSRARQTGGTGLGLSISLEDARLHGGWLEAWGAPHQGAQFRLTLPVRAGERLTSSPLRLVPLDAYLDVSPLEVRPRQAIEAAPVPEPGPTPHAPGDAAPGDRVPAQREVPDQATPTRSEVRT